MRVLENSWSTNGPARAVKFFAESILELTNIYSAPSYRHRTLSTVSKAHELKRGIRDVMLRVVKKPHLTPIIEEYSDSLQLDPVVNLTMEFKGLSSDLLILKMSDSLEKMEAKVDLFFDLVASEYEKTCTNMIKHLCAFESKEKTLIRICADHYVACKLKNGVSREHIHISAKREFSIISNAGDELPALMRFINACDGKERRYDLLINSPNGIGSILESTLNVENYKNKDDLPAHFRFGAFGKRSLSDEGDFSIVKGIPGKDPINAIRNLKSVLEMFHAFHFIFPNGPRWNLPASACSFDSETGGVYHTTISDYVHEGRRVGNPAKHRELIAGLTHFTLEKISSESKSGLKIYSALRSASAASRIPDADAQLISIWSAFEALLPHPSKDGESTVRISHFEGYITPLVTANYIEGLYRSLYNDLARNFKGAFYNFLKNNGIGKNKFDRFTSIFFADPVTKRAFTSLVSSSELLMMRCHELEKLANDQSAVRAKLEAHERRVSWQLHRIYRARNSIVHSGISPTYASHLTENAVAYFKSMMALIVRIGRKYEVEKSDALFDLCSSICLRRREKIRGGTFENSQKFLSFILAPVVE